MAKFYFCMQAQICIGIFWLLFSSSPAQAMHITQAASLEFQHTLPATQASSQAASDWAISQQTLQKVIDVLWLVFLNVNFLLLIFLSLFAFCCLLLFLWGKPCSWCDRLKSLAKSEGLLVLVGVLVLLSVFVLVWKSPFGSTSENMAKTTSSSSEDPITSVMTLIALVIAVLTFLLTFALTQGVKIYRKLEDFAQKADGFGENLQELDTKKTELEEKIKTDYEKYSKELDDKKVDFDKLERIVTLSSEIEKSIHEASSFAFYARQKSSSYILLSATIRNCMHDNLGIVKEACDFLRQYIAPENAIEKIIDTLGLILELRSFQSEGKHANQQDQRILQEIEQCKQNLEQSLADGD